MRDESSTVAEEQARRLASLLNIFAALSFWDGYGQLNADIDAARPDRCNGVQSIGGLHSDAFQTSNPLIHWIVYVGTSFSVPQNVEANLKTFLVAFGNADSATCAADPGDVLSAYGGPSPENSTQIAALSLDGRRQTVQSVGQHVCTV